MFFRMLKKDITEKKALNVILLLFMCFASILTVCSAVVLLTNTLGLKEARKTIHEAEVTVVSDRDLKDTAARQQMIQDRLAENELVRDVELSECIVFDSNAVDYVGFDEESVANIIHNYAYGFDLSSEHNQVRDRDGAPIELAYGTVAISEYVHVFTKMDIGDKVRITSQMGNIYEFEIAAITKDPGVDGWFRMFFNAEDFAVLLNDSPVISDVYMIKLTDGSTDMDQTQIVNIFVDNEDTFGKVIASYKRDGYHSSNLSSLVLNVVLVVVSFFLIIMVFMTVSFTIKTAIKNEEKELGMLKALGIESMSFNWLFAAKYLCIACIATLAGFFGGIPISKITVKYLLYGKLMPATAPTIVVALVASLMELVVILFFVAVSLRKMNKISIMDVIAGENRGERFKKLPGLFLHRLKRINIPLYLALTDLTNRIKRYSFLILAYTMGFTMIIMALEIENTANTTYWLEEVWKWSDFDFSTDFSDDMMEVYTQRGGSVQGAYDIINRELEDAGIPAHINYFNYCNDIKTTFKGENIVSFLQFNRHLKDEQIYRGMQPKLKNEVLIDAYHANIHGIEIGDTIGVSYYKYKEDGITYDLVTEDFLVTGTYDAATAELEIITSDAFPGAAKANIFDFGGSIDAPQSEHPYYIEKMREMYGKTAIRTRQEEVEYQLHEMGNVFKFVLWILIPMIFFMMVLVTILYQSVNLMDETPEIALLKCSGFGDGSIKSWQVLRSIFVTGISTFLGILIVNTGVYAFLRVMFYLLSNIMQYRPNRDIPRIYLLIPGLIIAVIAAVLYGTLTKVKRIELWKIRDNS